MPNVSVGEIQLAFEERGDPAGDPLVFIQGLGMPLTAWPDPLLDGFADDGYRVITFDNRDIGHSSLLSHLGEPALGWQLLRMAIGLGAKAPYRLDAMASDTVRLLDALRIESAHFVGVSMGAMIAQTIAIEHPAYMRSMTSIMSTTARPGLPGPNSQVRRQLVSKPKDRSLEARINHGMQTWRLIGSPDYRAEPADRRLFLKRNIERGVPREGILRQMVAIAASEPRHRRLTKIDIPTLVIHGSADPLVPLACGEDTANVIPNARLHVIEGMGHDLPKALLPEIAETIMEHLQAN